MKRFTRLLLFATLASPLVGGIASCSQDEDCSLSARASMVCGVYKMPSEEWNTLHQDTIDSLTVTAIGTDSVILNNQKNVTSLTLPLRYTADSTVFVLNYGGRLRDTLVVRQTNTPYFLSMDCGYQMKQAVSSVRYSRHVLDSLSIATADADIYGTENLRLFY
ncbi:MAG: DUF6452 family protein [Prevotellaceae bacterium]|nr:DUF6452 family protein [Prevotellaceae bacterium]